MEQATSLQRDFNIELPASSAKHPHEDVKDVTLIPTLAQAPRTPLGTKFWDVRPFNFNFSRDHSLTQGEIN
jgi:hypothetical protein